MEWELSKENYQPLRRGRKAAVVTSVEEELKTSCPKAASNAREEQRRAFWKEIGEYDGSDPLEVWLRFIKWVQESYREGGHQSELIPLLERCTRELQGHTEYTEDARYLRVWLQYADCLPEPRDVFNFLKANEIGLGWAMYYESFATYLELRGSFQKAEDVYAEGINRKAQPEGRLKQKLAAFQKRMDERNKKKAEERELGPSFEETLEANTNRSTLGTLAAGRPGGAVPSVRSNPRSILGSNRGLGQSRTNTASNRQPSGLCVFEDDNLDGSGTGTTGANWKKIPTFEQSRRENQQKAMPWVGAKVPQRKNLLSTSARPQAFLDILQDDYIEQDHGQQAREGTEKSKPSSLRQRIESVGGDSDLHERLMANPLLLHGNGHDAKIEKAAGGQGASEGTSRAPKGAVFAWNDETLRGDGIDELSFEETRAMQYRRQTPKPKPQATAAVKGRKKPLSVVSASEPVRGGGLQVFDESCVAEAPAADAKGAVSAKESLPAGGPGIGSLCIFDDSAADGDEPIAAAGGLCLGIREDTDMLRVPPSEADASGERPAPVLAAPESSPLGLGIREDTEFLSGTEAKAGDSTGLSFQIREDTDLLSAQGRENSGASGLSFQIREDTDLLSGGLQIREDTGFLTGTFGDSSNGTLSGSGLQIREDTDYITKPAESDGMDLGIREDTDYLNKPPLAKPPGRKTRRQPFGSVQSSGEGGIGLGIREDTDLLPTDAEKGTAANSYGDKKLRRRALGTLAQKPQDAPHDLADTAAEVNALLGSGSDYTEEQIRYSEPTATFMTEPTVTVATKEAMAAINDMFMSDLQH